MIFKTLIGSKKRAKTPKKYLIKWGSPSRSKIQFKTKRFLKKFWKDHVVFEEFPMVGSRLTFDFYNANKKIAVEVQGAQHLKYVPHFHGSSKSSFLSQVRRDQQKADFCKLNGITLIEIFSEEEIAKKTFKDQGIHL